MKKRNIGLTNLCLVNDFKYLGNYVGGPRLVRNAFKSFQFQQPEIEYLVRAVSCNRVVYPTIRIFDDGIEIDPMLYYEQRTQSGDPKVANYHSLIDATQKQSIMISVCHIQDYYEDVQNLCDSFGRILQGEANANLYICNADAVGFKDHHDTHDVVLFQIAGARKWVVKDSDNNIVINQTLQSGDMLYIPQGCNHWAFTDNQLSVHVTFGIKRPSLYDYLKWLIDKRFKNSFLLHRSILTTDGNFNKELLSAFLNDVDHVDTQQDFISRLPGLYSRYRPHMQDIPSTVSAAKNMSHVRFNTNYKVSLFEESSNVKFYLHGREWVFSNKMLKLFSLIASSGTKGVLLSELRLTLEDDIKRIIEDLIRNGILTYE